MSVESNVARTGNSAFDAAFERFWRLFSSVRFAILLIVLIAVAVFAGTVIAQAPSDLLDDPVSYEIWLSSVAQPRYGDAVPWMEALGLYRIFHVFWFRFLLALLTLAVIICTLNRSPGLIRGAFGVPNIRVSERFLRRCEPRLELSNVPLPPERVADIAAKVFRKHGYSVVPAADPGPPALYADKNRIFKLGTYINHIGLVMILGGAAFASLGGWQANGFIVTEGIRREVGRGTGLEIQLIDFTDEYTEDGQPKDYRSDVIIYHNGREVTRHTIRVNDPAEVNGVRFHQAFFGYSPRIRVTDSSGQVIMDQWVPMTLQVREQNAAAFRVPGIESTTWMLVWTAGVAPGLGDFGLFAVDDVDTTFEGQVMMQTPPRMATILNQNEPQTVGDLTFEFVEMREYTGLQLSSNPALPYIFTAAALMMIGIIAVFHFPHRRIWLKAQAVEGGTQLLVGGQSRRDIGFERSFAKLAYDLYDQLKSAEQPSGVAAAPAAGRA